MQNLALLVFCFAAGMALRHFHRSPENTSAVLNSFLINIGLPALALGYLNQIDLGPELALSIAAPWALFVLSVIVLWPVCRLAQLPQRTTGCVILMGGMANTSFLGIPFIEALYGASWVSVGVVMDQLGSYIVLSFLGITVAKIFSASSSPDPRAIALRILTFPPFLATIAGLALMEASYPQWLSDLFLRLAGTVAPLALVSVGFQLRLSDISGKVGPLVLGLGFKLFVGPAILFAILVLALGGRGTLTQITVLEVAMAPMIGASIVAMEEDLDPQLATLLVGIGVPVSFVTVTLWYYVLVGV